MKFATHVICLFALLGSASAQLLEPATMHVSGVAEIQEMIEIDADAHLHIPTRNAEYMNVSGIVSLDTLNDHYSRATAFRNYVYRDASNNTFPVVGSNTLYLFVGQKFPVSGNGRVLGVLLAAAMVRVSGQVDSMSINIFHGAETTGLPTASSLGYGRFLSNSVDTSFAEPRFSYVPMETEVNISGPFVVTVRTRRLSDNDDAFMIWSSNDGDGRGENRACYITVQNNQLVAGNLSSLISTGGVGINIDVMLLPVIDGSVSDVERPVNFNGLEFLGVAPQPAADIALLSLRSDRATNVSLDIIDVGGRMLGKSMRYNLTEGLNSLPIDFTNFRSGIYFLRISDARGSFATQVRILR